MINHNGKQMPKIKLDISHMMESMLGEHGISEARLNAIASCAAQAYQAVQSKRGTPGLGWTELPTQQDEIVAQIEQKAEQIKRRFHNFVVLGIGGSALGPSAVQGALSHLRYNELPDAKRPGPRFYVEDNIDPERMASLLDIIDVRETCFNVITKSGGTAETMSQFLIVRDLLQKAVGDAWREHIVVTTDPQKSHLLTIAEKEGLARFAIPSSVGGRFSELCPVGLLPAAVCGIDIRGLLAGAACMDERLSDANIWNNPALLEAALQVLAMNEKGARIQVALPYADSLRLMADWFCQLWAESLGKAVTRDGTPINAGQTPVKALGVTDQHSQLQLYTEGPFDKVITFLHVKNFRAETAIPDHENAPDDIRFLAGKTHNALIEAEYQGTEYALYRAGRMSQTITLPNVNAETIGQLIFFFEMVTAYAGELLNINAFDQPGVEESKRASYAVLGSPKAEHAKKRAEMETCPPRDARYIL